ncbi:MAG: hypothetical protein KatS3mg131_3172 [Candidatus Tectimicrobiota bacterium]|nr:MAG: hypothetical protein KatS3mg131_3172 [Candidatus Tectomicrobia bacterium]
MKKNGYGAGLVALLLFMLSQTGKATPTAYVLRFSDVPALQQAANSHHAYVYTPLDEPEAPAAPAVDWLKAQGWKQVWPLLHPTDKFLTFAGPHTQRYLRIATEDNYYIWTRRLEVDPQQLPILELTWGVERFPTGAALDLYRANDRALAVLVFFGEKVSAGGVLIPNVPRGLAFFWGETETVGATYTCVPARNGPAEVRMQCKYPHVKYIALRRGEAGTVHTDRVDLVALFKQHFPDYWQQHRRVPPVVAVSFEAGSNQTHSASLARLYALVFKPAGAPLLQPAAGSR